MSDTLIKLISEVLSISESDINENTSPENTVKWDSLNSVKLVIALTENYGIEFTNSEILGMRSVRLIRRLLIKKGHSVNTSFK